MSASAIAPLNVTEEGPTITVLTSDNGFLTKAFTEINGKVHKESHAHLTRGTFEARKVNTLADLEVQLDTLKPNQAVTYGRPARACGTIVSKSVKDAPAGAITRTRDYFHFPDVAGYLMLDYDPPKCGTALQPDDLINMLHEAWPALKQVGMLWRASSSSGVSGAGIRGQRIYIKVSDATYIPRIGELLFQRLWLAGYGYYAVSKSGQLLERGPIDASVWQPERMDFAAPPVLGPGISRTPYDSKITEGHVLDAMELAELSPAEIAKLNNLKAEARERIAPEVAAAQNNYMAEKAKELPAILKKHDLQADEEAIGVMLDRGVQQKTLMGNWPLTTSDGMSVTVGEIMDNPKKWHNARFADPLEPAHDLRVAYANLRSGGTPYIYSHANHGVRYRLDRAPAVINIDGADLPRMVDSVAENLQHTGVVFERGGAIVYVNDDAKIIQAKPAWMAVEVMRHCRFEQIKKAKDGTEVAVKVNCPSAVVHGVLSNAANMRLPKLTAVRNAPTFDCDGRQLTRPGYDEKTGLLLINEGADWPAVKFSPSHAELKKALEAIWMPFAQFPYATDADKSVMLAAVLTAAVRACLPTSPGFGFSATAPGTGKTLLAQCVGALYDGVAPAVSAPVTREEEWQKSLFSSALGGAGAVLYDNAEYPIESASLCAASTAPSIKSRVLGESRDEAVEHRMLMLATGNGLQFVGDLNRRFLTCRLDANMDAAMVASREFSMNPLSYCIKNRITMTVAGLTLIQGYLRAGAPRVCDGMASMEEWNKLVRSTIIWLIQRGVATDFVDPKAALTRDSAADPELTALQGVLVGCKSLFGTGNAFTVSDLIIRSSSKAMGFRDVLDDIAGNGTDINSKRLGQWLLKREGRIADGLCIKRGKQDRQKRATWMVHMIM